MQRQQQGAVGLSALIPASMHQERAEGLMRSVMLPRQFARLPHRLVFLHSDAVYSSKNTQTHVPLCSPLLLFIGPPHHPDLHAGSQRLQDRWVCGP